MSKWNLSSISEAWKISSMNRFHEVGRLCFPKRLLSLPTSTKMYRIEHSFISTKRGVMILRLGVWCNCPLRRDLLDLRHCAYGSIAIHYIFIWSSLHSISRAWFSVEKENGPTPIFGIEYTTIITRTLWRMLSNQWVEFLLITRHQTVSFTELKKRCVRNPLLKYVSS